MMQKLKILLSAGASPASYNIIRHLKNLGHVVHAVDANEKALPLARTIADKAEKAPLASETDYIPFMTDLIRKTDLFIPFVDEEIARLIQYLEDDLWEKCLLPNRKTTTICLYKKEFQKFCMDNDLPVAPSSNTIPSIFKPNLGRGGKGVEIIDNLPYLKQKMKAEGVIQEWIRGKEYTIDALFSKTGEIVSISSRKRDQAKGVSVIGTIVDSAPFLPVVKSLGEILKFRYLINIQLMEDTSGNYHIIEINPRIAGSVMFSVYSGRDFLKGAIELFKGKEIFFKNKQKKIRIIRYWNEHIEDLSS
jgi:carbamoyl-phosphate synthase large subunit